MHTESDGAREASTDRGSERESEGDTCAWANALPTTMSQVHVWVCRCTRVWGLLYVPMMLCARQFRLYCPVREFVRMLRRMLQVRLALRAAAAAAAASATATAAAANTCVPAPPTSAR